MDIKIDCAFDSLVPIEKLVRHPRNNNRHSIEQIDALSKLIKAHGFRHSLVVSNRSGFIVAGHGRLEAALKLGIKELPVDYQDFSSEAEEYQCLTADNEIARWAELDYQNIYDTLKELPDVDVSLLGIEDFKLPEEEIIPQCDEDEVPEAPPVPRTKRGDIWLLGNHRLMCGDSTMIDDVEKLMNGEKADMVFTDPPYGVNYSSNMRTKSDKFEVIKNDDVILDIVPIIEMFSRGFVFIWTTWKVMDKWLDNTKGMGFPSNVIVWFKGGGGIGDLKKTFSTDWEMSLVWHRGCELTGKRIGSVWSIGKDKAIDYKHPTQKPVSLAEEALDKVSKQGYRVLDLFGGSGSTLIACEKMQRQSYNMELDEKYCDVIIQRWQKYTGKEAILESTKQKYNELNENR
jgi:DNA modification methylase